MKIYKIILLAAILIIIAFVIKLSRTHDHDHDHAAAGQAVSAQEPAGDHDHDHAAASPAAGEDHDNESGAEEHDHESEGFIAVDSTWEKLVGLRTQEARIEPLLEIVTVPGVIVPDADRIAVVTPLIEAGVNCVMAAIGDRVNRGDELICLSSPEVGTLRADYDKARAEQSIAEANYRRMRKLWEEKIISERAWQEAERDRELAEVNLTYARKRLLAVGISEDQLDSPPEGHGTVGGSTIHLHAPLAGVITARNANLGEKVGTDDRLFEIIDLSRVWCEAELFEKDITRVRIGQLVRIRVAAWPDDVFSGRIFYIGGTLNERTRTLDVLVDIDNRHEKLKPGMFADAGIVTGEKARSLVIPVSAVMEDENLQIVFVKEGEGYHRHVITTGIRSGESIEVLSGIEPGAVVVTEGSYQLRSRARMQGVDPHAGHVH
ncbi:efflux RND transporter periplasmic adaptor subunit [bacterium]|nr:efflux RND transporter periplasmic adaptor subunit [bacterium]